MSEVKFGIWEKYLSVWVFLFIVVGIAIGRLFPGVSDLLGQFSIAYVNVPIAICLFAMIYPIMVQIDFNEVIRAGKTIKPIAATLFVNWAIKPFTMAFFGWAFLLVMFSPFIPDSLAAQYQYGLILLGVAPCTAMVLVWSYLARGNMGHTLVMVAINSLTMVALYAPLAVFLLGISGISIPWETIGFAITMYILLPLIAGFYTRRYALRRKGLEWLNTSLKPKLGRASIIALLVTLIILFSTQGYLILEQPLVIVMIALPIFINILVIFIIAYAISKLIGLPYEDAAPTALIGGSNHFEVAIAVAITLFGLESGAALSTVVGVLTEVPFMLLLVYLCKATRGWFKAKDRD
jgi:ACR3 family arsenite transporter|uniref:ACR3 family arsenite efflux transporter n=1 Tax=Candidatus Methanosuratincola petrocarbonis (ex Vanwonterghem et al. 2016) TaxID=1867261 RepID=A0A7J3UXT4_9CREN